MASPYRKGNMQVTNAINPSIAQKRTTWQSLPRSGDYKRMTLSDLLIASALIDQVQNAIPPLTPAHERGIVRDHRTICDYELAQRKAGR